MSETAALDGRRVLVTGAASGIGRAAAIGCLQAGATVFGIDRDETGLSDVSEHGVLVGRCDIRSFDQVESTVQSAASVLGGLDAVVNNAGVLRLGPVAGGDTAEWRLMIETNLLGLLYVTRTALEYLRSEERADVVNISSLSGRRVAHSRAAVYTATKAAVHALSDAMRSELASYSIRTTVIAPGAVNTSLSEGISDASLRSEIRGLHDDVGLAPDDVARQIVHVLGLNPTTLITEVGIQSIGHAGHGAS